METPLMDEDTLRRILLAVSLGSIAVAVLGLIFGFPFLGFFLFLPFIGYGGGFGRSRRSGTYGNTENAGRCPECSCPIDPSDSFCRVCGRRL